MEKKTRNNMIKVAFVTSPIIAVFTIIPMVLFVNSLGINGYSEIGTLPHYGKVAAGITLVVLMQWLFNIFLLGQRDKVHFFKKRPWVLLIISYAFVLDIIIVGSYISKEHGPSELASLAVRYYPFVGSLANNTFIIVFLFLLDTRSKQNALVMEKTQLELKHAKTQQHILKDQLQPHFLFNALNTLNLLIKKNPDKAETYTLKLSKLLRRSLTHSDRETALVKEEIYFFEDYVRLQNVRFLNTIEYKIELDDLVSKIAKLPVFTLQILAENAIKHNNFNQNQKLFMHIFISDNKIVFSNNILPMEHKVDSNMIGLLNLSERFQFLNESDIIIEHTKENFNVKFEAIL